MSAISFLAGLGAGYQDRQDKEAERARQARIDQVQLDRENREATDWNQARADLETLRQAATPVQVETIQPTKPDTMDNADVGQPGEAPLGPATYRVGAQTFASRGVADQAARTLTQANFSAAQDRIDPAGASAREVQRMQVQAMLGHAKQEGTTRALSAALALGPAGAEQVKQIYNPFGTEKVRTLQIIPIDSTNPATGAPEKSVRLVGETTDGDPFEIPDAAHYLYRTIALTHILDAEMKKQEFDQKAQQFDRTATREEKAAAALARYHDAMASAAAERAGNSGKGKADPLDRMSEADKQEYLGIREQIKSINDKVATAMSQDSWNSESANAKALNTRLAALNLRGKALLDRYAEDDSAPDPAGIRPAKSNGPKLTTRPPTDMEKVQQSMAKDGVTDATFFDNGKEVKIGKGAAPSAVAAFASKGATPPPPAAPVAQPVQQSAQIPAPPPQSLQQGLRMVPNPAYVEWEKKFGEAWRQQRAQQAAADDAAALAARASYNPYQQGRVR